MTFTLQEVLAYEQFGLELVVGSDSVDRQVAGAHALEWLDDPLEWIPSDWIMLSTCIRLPADEDSQRQLVARLAEGNVCALGLGVGFGYDDVPPLLHEAAADSSFPIFTVPRPTPFRDIIRFIDGALLSTDLHQLRRAFSIHGHLLDAIAEEDPELELVNRLGGVLSCKVALFGGSGELLASSSEEDLTSWWDDFAALRDADDPRKLIDYADRLIIPVRSPRVPTRWLVVSDPGAAVSRPVARRIASSCVPILQGLANLRRREQVEKRGLQADLFDELMLSTLATTASTGAIAAGAEALGLRFESGVRVVLARGPNPSASADALDERFERDGINYSVGRLDGHVGMVVEDRPDLAATLELVAAGLDRTFFGVGRAIYSHAEVGISLRDAEVAVAHYRDDASRDLVISYESLKLTQTLLLSADVDSTVGMAKNLLQPIEERQDLRETLITYLNNSMDIPTTARVVHIHPNSARHRLARVEELLGIDLHNPADLVELHIALSLTSGDEDEADDA